MPLSIHFLNVGHGDCTIIEHPSGRITMVDINNSKSLPDDDVDALADQVGVSKSLFTAAGFGPTGFRSWADYYESLLVDPTDFFKTTFGSWRSVFRYIQTHPDMDHLSGLHRFFWQEKIVVENMWDTAHTKTKTEDDFSGTRYSYFDWLVYQEMRQGRLVDDRTHRVLHRMRNDAGDYWTEDGIAVLGPTPEILSEADLTQNWNNSSYILKVSHAGRTVILPGDAEAAAWNSVLAAFTDDVLRCDVLKAAHHGRESGYSEAATSAMDPSIVVCSVGKKPSTDASDEYASHGARVLSTRSNGTITVVIEDNGSVSVTNHLGEELETLPAVRSWLSA